MKAVARMTRARPERVAQDERLRALAAQRLFDWQIADAMGLSIETIRSYRKRLGIPATPVARGRAQAEMDDGMERSPREARAHGKALRQAVAAGWPPGAVARRAGRYVGGAHGEA
jgi:hypothetical protein